MGFLVVSPSLLGFVGIGISPRRVVNSRSHFSFPNVRHKRHKSRPLDGILNCALKSGTIAAAFSTENLALVGAQFLQRLHVFVIDKRGARAAFSGAKTAAILSTSS
jgi:hypothetical protein